MLKVEIRGKQLKVEVDDNGIFECQLDPDTHIRADSLEKLKARLLDATKRKEIRVSVPVYKYVKNEGLKSGTAIGIHAANGNVLIKWDGEKGVEQSSWGSYLQIDPADMLAAKRICNALAEAERAYNLFSMIRVFNPKQAVLAAINKVDPDFAKRTGRD